MASPLKWFRKYEKTLLAVFGVLLMFVFSLGAVSLNDIFGLTDRGGGSGSNEDTVVTWSEGALTEAELQQLRFSRNQLLNFAQSAFMAARERGANARAFGLPTDISDGSLLELALLSRQADEMGLSINDQAIVDFLVRFTDGKLKNSELAQLWKNATNGMGSERELLGLFRRELKAMHVRAMMQSGIRPVSPLHKWQQYNQMERRLKAEVVEIPVSDFVEKVREPSSAELQEFFDEYKDQYAYANSPDPGFRIREKAVFEYIKFDRDQFIEAEMALVTQSQIEAYYEENKDQFREQSFLEDDLKLDVPEAVDSAEGTLDSESAEIASDADMQELGGGESTDESNDESTNESAVESTGESEPAEETVEADSSSAPPEASDETPEQDSKSDENAVDSDESPAAEDPAPDESANQDEPVEDAAEESPQPSPTPTPQDDATSTEPAESTETADSNQTEPDNQTEIPAAEEETADTIQPETLSDDTDRTEEPTDDALEESDESRFKPLEKVEDEIRRRLAEESAVEKFGKAISQTRNLLDSYYKEREYYNLQVTRKQEAELPDFPDLSQVDCPYPLTVEDTPLCDERTIADTELGTAYDIRFNGRSFDQISFNQIAFDKGQPLYNPRQFPQSEVATVIYLYWKTEVAGSYEPKLAEVKEQVIDAWKKQEAAELAKSEADKLVLQANETAGKTLVESLSRESFEIEDVAWIMGGNIPGDPNSMPSLAPIAGIESPSRDVYQTLFGLEIGTAGYALNQPRDRIYIMRPISQTPDEGIRRAGFMQNALLIAGLNYLERDEWGQQLQSSYEQFLEQKDVEWLRQPESGLSR